VRSSFVCSKRPAALIAMAAIEADCLATTGTCFKSDGVDAFFRGGCFCAIQKSRTDSAATGLRENDHPLQLGGAVVRDQERYAPDWFAIESSDEEPHRGRGQELDIDWMSTLFWIKRHRIGVRRRKEALGFMMSRVFLTDPSDFGSHGPRPYSFAHSGVSRRWRHREERSDVAIEGRRRPSSLDRRALHLGLR
jgi:hypothetical protein